MESLNRGSLVSKLGILAVGLALTSSTYAVYQPSQLPDPSRRWGATLSLQQGYDDNVNTSADKQGSATTSITPRLYLNFPLDQTFIGLRYSYSAMYYWDRAGEGWDQSHIADILFSHRFSPRLTLNIDDSMRRGIEPELVDLGQISRRESDYWFNSLTAGLTWNATRRWLLGLSQSWEHWSYDDQAIADDSDRNTLSTGVNSTYTLDPVSSIGLNFRYSTTLYEDAGPDDVRDSQTETVFLSYTRLFSPQLTMQIAGGAGFSQFGDDHDDVSPYASASLAYTYAPDSTVSFNSTYSFVSSDVGVYRSSDTLVLSLQASHRLTRKCRVSVGADYINRNYQNPDPTMVFTLSEQSEDAARARVAVSYAFTRWVSADFSYSYERIWSDIGGRSFDRNRVYGGLRFTF